MGENYGSPEVLSTIFSKNLEDNFLHQNAMFLLFKAGQLPTGGVVSIELIATTGG